MVILLNIIYSPHQKPKTNIISFLSNKITQLNKQRSIDMIQAIQKEDFLIYIYMNIRVEIDPSTPPEQIHQSKPQWSHGH